MPTILLRRGTSTEWAAKNPVLGAGELGVDLTEEKIKLGDGVTPWNSLAFINAGGGGGGNSWGSITGTLSSQTDLQTALNGKEATITVGTTAQYWRGDKSWQPLNKAAVGLGNIDNTSDANKPISTATQAALDGKLGTSAQAATVATIASLIIAGTNITITGAGTTVSPYVINGTSGGDANYDGGSAVSVFGGSLTINGGNA